MIQNRNKRKYMMLINQIRQPVFALTEKQRISNLINNKKEKQTTHDMTK